MVNWGLVATLGIAGAAVAGIVIFRDRIVSGVTSAGFTAGQTAGAIPSSIAGGLQSGLNPLRQVLGQPTVNPPTYTYTPPIINTQVPNPAIAQAQQLTSIPPAPVPSAFTYTPNPSSPATRAAARRRSSSSSPRYVAGSQTQTLVKQTTNPATGRVSTSVSRTPGVSAYYAGTPTARSTINFGKTSYTTQLSRAAINYYKSRGVKVTPA